MARFKEMRNKGRCEIKNKFVFNYKIRLTEAPTSNIIIPPVPECIHLGVDVTPTISRGWPTTFVDTAKVYDIELEYNVKADTASASSIIFDNDTPFFKRIVMYEVFAGSLAAPQLKIYKVT